jgi:hypothetical protein
VPRPFPFAERRAGRGEQGMRSAGVEREGPVRGIRTRLGLVSEIRDDRVESAQLLEGAEHVERERVLAALSTETVRLALHGEDPTQEIVIRGIGSQQVVPVVGVLVGAGRDVDRVLRAEGMRFAPEDDPLALDGVRTAAHGALHHAHADRPLELQSACVVQARHVSRARARPAAPLRPRARGASSRHGAARYGAARPRARRPAAQ